MKNHFLFAIVVSIFACCIPISSIAEVAPEAITEDDAMDQLSPAEALVYDPFEKVNRVTFSFNQKFDSKVALPVTRAYREYTPTVVRTGVSNFLGNMDDVVSLANAALQGKFVKAVNIAGRVVFNSTFGVFGLIDWASMNGMPKQNEDFGQTLHAWGVSNGPYIVLPLLGPSTLKDTTGLVFDAFTVDPLYNQSYLQPVYDPSRVAVRNSAVVLDGIRVREKLLNGTDIADEAALDPYLFYRSAYYQYRLKESNK